MAKTHATPASMTVKIVVNDKGNPPGKLADAELHFSDGPLAPEVDRLCDLGAPQRRWPQRDVPCAAVLRERRATQLRVAAADHRYDGARGCPRCDPCSIRRSRERGCCPAVTGEAGRRSALRHLPLLIE